MAAHGARRSAHFRRGESLAFRFDGRPIEAFASDTIASALIASGERIFTNHPTSGEARGGFCFVGRCQDCLVIVDGQPGVMACTTPVKPGIVVETQVGLGHWHSETTE
jgi:predicted molibdopterin-dependent oxidoreductase YjgC